MNADKYKLPRGITVVFSIGQSAKSHFRKSDISIRFCLGRIALTIYFYDHEVAIFNQLKEIK